MAVMTVEAGREGDVRGGGGEERSVMAGRATDSNRF